MKFLGQQPPVEYADFTKDFNPALLNSQVNKPESPSSPEASSSTQPTRESPSRPASPDAKRPRLDA